jgi:hypothetical protein
MDLQTIVAISRLSSCFHVINVLCAELERVVAHWFGFK